MVSTQKKILRYVTIQLKWKPAFTRLSVSFINEHGKRTELCGTETSYKNNLYYIMNPLNRFVYNYHILVLFYLCHYSGFCIKIITKAYRVTTT